MLIRTEYEQVSEDETLELARQELRRFSEQK